MKVKLYGLILLIAGISCKSTESNNRLQSASRFPIDPVQSDPAEIKILTYFDWIDKDYDLAVVPKRDLVFCLSEPLLQHPIFGEKLGDEWRERYPIEIAAEQLNNIGTPWVLVLWPDVTCPEDWKLDEDKDPQEPEIRVTIANLGAAAGQFGLNDETDIEEPSTQPGAKGAPNTLAYFQAGPKLAGTNGIRRGEIVFNIHPSVAWSTKPGSLAFDPINVAMHEFGHAVRLDHYRQPLSTDRRLFPTGSMPPPLQPAIVPGANRPLQTTPHPNDVVSNDGKIYAGEKPQSILDSGVLSAVMHPSAVFGRHGINPEPLVESDFDSRYNFDPVAFRGALNSARP